MAVPTFVGPYVDVGQIRGATVNSTVATGWTGADFFEIGQLPPSFTFDGGVGLPGALLGGTISVDMVYSIAVRAGNADGLADWENLRFLTINAPISWTLYGAPVGAWSPINTINTDFSMYVQRVRRSSVGLDQPAGALYLSPSADKSTAVTLNTGALDSVVELSGTNGMQFNSTAPGWELLVS